MIYHYPSAPPPNGTSIFLFGSVGPWIRDALRELERADRAIAFDDQAQPVTDAYQHWQWHWMRYATVRGCWIAAGHHWAQFELGLCMGWGTPLVIGSADETLRKNLGVLLGLLDRPTCVHDSVESMCDFLCEFI